MNRLVACSFLLLTALAGIASAQKPVYVVEITDEIDLGLVPYVDRVAAEAEANGGALILHINTFGGRVDAATQIKDALLNANVRTIAFVDKRAISAGALIALSCKTIVMTEGGTMGAATPIYASGEKASEKVVSFMRSEMRSIAERAHRRPDIAEAMVDEDVTLSDSALVKAKGKLLTLTTDEAVKVGYCDTVANSMSALLDAVGLHGAQIVNSSQSLGERAVRFLTNAIVSGILILIGLGGVFYTFKTGHLGVVTLIAGIAFVLFFGAAYVAKLATVIVLLMFLGGLFLLLLEIGTPIPTFGIAGLIGIVLTIGSLFIALVGNLVVGDTTRGMWILSGALGGFILAVVLMVRYLPKTPWWRKFILTHEEKQTQGYVATATVERFLGRTGEAMSILRPAGIALIDGERVDVVTKGEYMPVGTSVKVVEVSGSRVVVERNVER